MNKPTKEQVDKYNREHRKYKLDKDSPVGDMMEDGSILAARKVFRNKPNNCKHWFRDLNRIGIFNCVHCGKFRLYPNIKPKELKSRYK